MRELEELIKKRIQLLEENIESAEEENKKDENELETLNKKLSELNNKKNTLSLNLTNCRNKLDIIERFYYSVDKLEVIEENPKAISKDDIENIDQIDWLLDGIRDKWIEDVQLARYYLMHKESIENSGLKEAIEKVHKIFIEIKTREEKLHEDIEKFEQGVKTATKTIREYRNRIKELEKKVADREKEKAKLLASIEFIKSIDPDEILTISPKFMEELRKIFTNDQEYLEFLKTIVKSNSELLKTNPKLEKLIVSIKEKLENASTYEEKEQLTGLYLILLYSKSGKDKEGIINEYLESTDYTIPDVSAFLKLIDIDIEENLKLNSEKIAKKISHENVKSLKGELLKKYNVVRSALENAQRGSIEIRFAKYLIVDDEESIDALYKFVVLQNISRYLAVTTYEALSERLEKSDDEYAKALSKVIRELVRNKYKGNRNENDINDYEEIEKRLISIITVDKEKIVEAFNNPSTREKIVLIRINDESGEMDISKVKDVLLLYKKKEISTLISKAADSSPLKMALLQIDEIICDEKTTDEFIDELLITDIKDERKGKELLRNHMPLLFDCRKRLIESIPVAEIEDQLELYYEALTAAQSKYVNVFEKMRLDVYDIQNANFNTFRPFLGKLMINLVEEDIKNKTDSSDFLRRLVKNFKEITEAGYDDYNIYNYLQEYASRLEEIDLDQVKSKEELLDLVEDKMQEELKELLQKTEEKSEAREGTLIIFKTDDESELFHPDVNQNEMKKLIESGLRHLREMSYESLTKHQGSVDKIKNSRGVNGLYRYRSGDIRICYKVIEPETIDTLNKNNDFDYQAGIVVIYVIKKHGDSSIYNDEVVPRAVEFIQEMQKGLIEELTIGTPEAIDNTIRSNERIYRKYTRHSESGIGAKSYE